MAKTSVLEEVTKEAISILIEENATRGRHGIVLSDNQKDSLIDEIYLFISKSIEIKNKGQSLLAGPTTQTKQIRDSRN